MYRLFMCGAIPYSPLESNQMERVRENIKTRIDYLKNNKWVYGKTINSNHLLMRLCMILAPYVKPESDTYRVVRENLPGICTSLHITSSYSYGKVHSQCLYTTRCVVLSTDYSAAELPADWKDYRPVRCLTHQETSLQIRLPPSTISTRTEGISAIGIDIPMFAAMLQRWLIINNGRDPLTREPLATFITKYVLPGTVYEYLDIAIRNRLVYANIKDIPISKRSSTAMMYEQETDNINRRTINLMKGSNRSYKRTLLSIPMFHSENYIKAVDDTISELNPFSYWAQLLVYVDWLYPLLTVVNNWEPDIAEVKRILNRIKQYINNSGVLAHMPPEVSIDFILKYNECVTFLTKK